MVRPGLVRLLGAPVVGLFAALVLGHGSVMAAVPGCTVTVDSASAVGGTVFTFTGSGFHPTRLLLQKGDAGPTSSDIAPQGDPWTQAVQSRVGDEGEWSATFVEENGCTVAVAFEVALAPTDMISDLLPGQPNSALPALFYTLVTGFGLVGGAFLSRRLGAARSGMRH